MIRRFGIIAAVAAALTLGTAARAAGAVITLTNSTVGLFDASSGNRTVNSLFGGAILDVNISINFAKADGEAFNPPFPGGTPFHNEIVFRLTSPGGTTVNLINPNSFDVGSVLFDGTIVFDDAALNVVNVNPNLPQAGTFRPIGSLADFNGEDVLGTWTLFIQDTVGADALRFREFTLEVTVPEPATMLLFGAGLAGVIARRARRRNQ